MKQHEKGVKMAKGDICNVSNCNNILQRGNVCGTHRWRKKKFNSYDLPDHIGTPNILIKKILPEGIVKICDKHGQLIEQECYLRYYKGKVSSYYCKKCALDKNIKLKYQGLESLNCYDRLCLMQNNACAICKQPNKTKRNNKLKRMAIDHCHKTMKIRGLLCHHCNALIGYAKDSIEILKAAIKYLEENTATN